MNPLTRDEEYMKVALKLAEKAAALAAHIRQEKLQNLRPVRQKAAARLKKGNG